MPRQKSDNNGSPIKRSTLVRLLAGRDFYSRGWVLGTSGNFSAVTSPEPLRLAITSTGLDKGSLTLTQFLEIDDNANVIQGEGHPSTEALLHIAIVRCVNAAA